jgi:hypothetical protein
LKAGERRTGGAHRAGELVPPGLRLQPERVQLVESIDPLEHRTRQIIRRHQVDIPRIDAERLGQARRPLVVADVHDRRPEREAGKVRVEAVGHHQCRPSEGGEVVGRAARIEDLHVTQRRRERQVAQVVAQQPGAVATRPELGDHRHDVTVHCRLLAQRDVHQLRVPDREQCGLRQGGRDLRQGEVEGAEQDGRAAAELCVLDADAGEVGGRRPVPGEGDRRGIVQAADHVVGHDVGPVDQRPVPAVDPASREAEEHQRRLQPGERQPVDVEVVVLVEVATADDDAVAVLVDLVDRSARQPAEPAAGRA